MPPKKSNADIYPIIDKIRTSIDVIDRLSDSSPEIISDLKTIECELIENDLKTQIQKLIKPRTKNTSYESVYLPATNITLREFIAIHSK